MVNNVGHRRCRCHGHAGDRAAGQLGEGQQHQARGRPQKEETVHLEFAGAARAKEQ